MSRLRRIHLGKCEGLYKKTYGHNLMWPRLYERYAGLCFMGLYGAFTESY